MISRVEKVCRNHGWETPEIKQLTMKFSGLREMHEMVHDLQFAKNFANLETLSKMVGNTLAGDLDTWIWYTPTMRYALAVYSENIRHIMRLHGGYLPPELMDQSSIFVTELDQNAKEHFRQLVKSGKITELNSLNKKLKSENTKEKQKAAEEMHRALRVARAFGTITLRLPSMISEAKIPRWYGSGPDNNLIQDMDPFRHLIFKYGMGKPALAKLYTTLGGDEKAAMQFSSMSEDEIYEVFNRTEQDPAFADTYANFRNFFKMATRLGDGKGFWGMILGMKEFPQELREVRGVGLKLLDARRRAELEIRAQKLNRRFKPDNRGVPPSEQSGNPEISRAWRKYSKEKSIQNEIANLTKIYTDEAMNELVNKLPGEVIDRTSLDAGYEHLGFDAVEHTLEGQRPDLFKKILRVDDGTKDGALLKITINGVQHEIRSFYELYSIDPRNNPTEVHIGIPESERQDLVRRIDLMNKVSYQLAGDLSIVQQVAINQIIDNAIKGISFDPKKMDATFLDGYMDALADSVGEESGLKLEPSDRRTMTQEYIKQIHTAINTDLDEQKKPIQPYVKHLTQRFINGYEHNIFTTSDVPLDKIHYRNWGSSVLSRTVGDALSVSTGEKGLADYFGLFEGQPDQKILFQTLKEKIKTPIASADPDTAINISGWCIDAFLRQYRESDLATYTGIFGRALTSTIAIETTEKISHFLGQHGRIPRFMWGSLSQRLIDPGAMRMTSSDVWSFTREAAEKGLLPKDENVAGWQMSGSYRPGYTKNDLRNRYHGNLINVVPQIGTTVTPLSMGFMIYQGIKERDEEKH
jgi:hypothetical protein